MNILERFRCIVAIWSADGDVSRIPESKIALAFNVYVKGITGYWVQCIYSTEWERLDKDKRIPF